MSILSINTKADNEALKLNFKDFAYEISDYDSSKVNVTYGKVGISEIVIISNKETGEILKKITTTPFSYRIWNIIHTQLTRDSYFDFNLIRLTVYIKLYKRLI